MTEPASSSNAGAPSGAERSHGGAASAWPVPDTSVRVAGAWVPVDVAAAAALYAAAAGWLLVNRWYAFTQLPHLITDPFGGMFRFWLSWGALVATAVLAYLVAALASCAYLLVRGKPTGRGLATMLFAALVALLFTDARSPAMTTATLISGSGVAILYASPWAHRMFAQHDVGSRPAPVTLSASVASTWFGLLGLLAVLLLPGVQYRVELGTGFVVFEALCVAAVLTAFSGLLTLSARPSLGRWLLTAAAVGAAAAHVYVQPVGLHYSSPTGDATAAVGVAVLCGIVAPLWLVSAGRAWFGGAPLIQPGPSKPRP